MSSMMSTARSASARATVLLSVALAVVFAATAQATVGLVGAPIRSRWFVLLAFAVLCTVPLAQRFGVVESTLTRPVRLFATRLCVAAFPFSVGLSACFALVPRDEAVRWWFVLLVAASVAVSALASEAAWAFCLVVGVASIMVDYQAATLPVSNLVTEVGPAGSGAVVLAAVGLVLRRGGAPIRSDRVTRLRWSKSSPSVASDDPLAERTVSGEGPHG